MQAKRSLKKNSEYSRQNTSNAAIVFCKEKGMVACRALEIGIALSNPKTSNYVDGGLCLRSAFKSLSSSPLAIKKLEVERKTFSISPRDCRCAKSFFDSCPSSSHLKAVERPICRNFSRKLAFSALVLKKSSGKSAQKSSKVSIGFGIFDFAFNRLFQYSPKKLNIAISQKTYLLCAIY